MQIDLAVSRPLWGGKPPPNKARTVEMGTATVRSVLGADDGGSPPLHASGSRGTEASECDGGHGWDAAPFTVATASYVGG